MPSSLSRKLVLIAAFAATVIGVGCKKKEAKNEPSGTSEPPPVVNPGGGGGGGGGGTKGAILSVPPAGWCEVRDVIGGLRVFLPGDKPVVPDPARLGSKGNLATGCYATIKNPNINAEVKTFSIPHQAGAKVGSAPDELFTGLRLVSGSVDQLHDVLEKTPVTLGGKPALKIVLKRKASNRPKMNVGNDPFFAKMEAEFAEREKKEQAMRQVFYITNTGTRIIIIQVDTPGEPEPAVVKTVIDSFAFL